MELVGILLQTLVPGLHSPVTPTETPGEQGQSPTGEQDSHPLSSCSHQCPTAPSGGHGLLGAPQTAAAGLSPQCPPAQEKGCRAVPSLRLRQRHRPLPFQTSLTPPKVTLSLLQQELPGDIRRGQGARGGPQPHQPAPSTPGPPPGWHPRRHRTCPSAQPSLSPPEPTPAPHTAPAPHSQPAPRSPLWLLFCLCAPSLRLGPAGGSSKALPLLNPSIIDIVAEPPGAGGGWQRYYLHLSSFLSSPPALPRQPEKPRDQAGKSRLRLLSCSLAFGEGDQADPPAWLCPPQPCLCCPWASGTCVSHV